MNNDTLTTKEFVKILCKTQSDEEIRKYILVFKETPLIGLFNTGRTWFDLEEKTFVKYLKKFDRKEISFYL
jgi:hypothetical protein